MYETKHRGFLNGPFHYYYWPSQGLFTNSEFELTPGKYVRTAGGMEGGKEIRTLFSVRVKIQGR